MRITNYTGVLHAIRSRFRAWRRAGGNGRTERWLDACDVRLACFSASLCILLCSLISALLCSACVSISASLRTRLHTRTLRLARRLSTAVVVTMLRNQWSKRSCFFPEAFNAIHCGIYCLSRSFLSVCLLLLNHLPSQYTCAFSALLP